MIATHPASPRSVAPPYPGQYVSQWTMRDGRKLVIRPIRPEDEPLLAQFHTTLSLETVYARYSQVLPLGRRAEHDRLAHRCTIDYDDEFALVAIDRDPHGAKLVGVARLSKMPNNNAEFAIVIADSYQHEGLGTRLLNLLVGVAQDKKLDRVIGYINSDNSAMCAVCRRLGFAVDWPTMGPTRIAVLPLRPLKPR
jgi:acetyltransferase